MTDVLNTEQRSRNMAAIKCKNTLPEKVVRSLVHRMGFRYALHRKDLPGKPDIVLVSRRKIIQIHGCFWHMHTCRFGAVTPKTRPTFWRMKRLGNVDRDKRNQKLLKKQGWRILTIWECMTSDRDRLANRLQKFLSS